MMMMMMMMMSEASKKMERNGMNECYGAKRR
jgi:hypothetical protein